MGALLTLSHLWDCFHYAANNFLGSAAPALRILPVKSNMLALGEGVRAGRSGTLSTPFQCTGLNVCLEQQGHFPQLNIN